MFTIFTVHVFQPKNCGLKTRKEDEVKDALTVLVNAVKKKRQESESTTA